MNLFIQIFAFYSLGLPFASFFLILLLYILYFITQLQLLERICGQIGNREEKLIMDRLLNSEERIVALPLKQENENIKSDKYLRLIVNLQSEVIA